MEPQKKNKNARNIIIVAVAVIIVGSAIWSISNRATLFSPKFCFNFVHDTQFGDRKIANPANQGFGGPSGIFYYIPEVPALQTALKKQGFYIDQYEATGGNVYAAAFFGPSTKSAVMDFQKKNSLPQSGEVNNDTIDKLASIYKCPSIVPVATTTKAE